MSCRKVQTKCACFTDASGDSETVVFSIVYDNDGVPIASYYTDAAGNTLDTSTGSVKLGECKMDDDVFRVVQPLVSGNNTIVHGLGKSEVEVEVRNDSTGAIISAIIVTENINDTVIFVPVAVANARISIDV